jgi:adenine-specific DNA-methyltransferase
MPKTELVWDGKYDANGKPVSPLRVALPFQTVEMVNESVQERQKSLSLFETPTAYLAKEWRNRLIWGDKRYVLPSLLSEYAGKVNLIYIDPPFDTGADFSFTASVPEHPGGDDENQTFTKHPSIIEQKAYRDTWGKGIDSYLQWFYETVLILHELLAENGSLYVHLDWHVSHHAKVILDEVFGPSNLRNEIIWKRTTARSDSSTYNHIHDVIFFFTKSDQFTWHTQYQPYSKEYLASNFKPDDKGRMYRESPITAPEKRTGLSGKPWKGLDPNTIGKGRHWAIPNFVRYLLSEKAKNDPIVALNELEKAGRIIWARDGEGRPNVIQYADEMEGVELQSIWLEFSALSSNSKESVDYPTQKPEALLERIINCSSNPSDLVLDCFCGSGTTAAVSEKKNRRWITCDLGRFAIHTARKRLLSIENVRPFVVQNLGKYERQQWSAGEFGNGEISAEGKKQAAARQRAYIEFILQLYGAKPIHGHALLHGLKSNRMVHVGSVEAPISLGDITQICAEFKKTIGSGKDAPKNNGIDVLGWDFAFEINEMAQQQAAAANINLKFWKIPREVMEKKAVEQGEIRFFELAALAVEVKTKGRDVALKLTDFMIPPDDVPEEARKSIKHWSQWIDYWAVDWNFKGQASADTFHNEWQAYRTRQDATLELATTHPYPDAGEYTVVVKVIDILGNDTTKAVKVKIS